MSEIVRKYFLFGHLRFFAKRPHIPPYIASVDRFSAFGDKHRAAPDSCFFNILPQKSLYLNRQKDNAFFIFTADRSSSGMNCFNRNIFQFAYTDSRSADRLNDIRQTAAVRRFYKSVIFLKAQFPIFSAEHLPLNSKKFYAQLFKPAKP